jgi:transcriptional regulator with XRE-family HTH domain
MLGGVDRRHEVRQFLTSRRARLSPQAAGVPVRGDERRVPGLRRDEVAGLAGVSVDYYIRLERGNLHGASDSVLDALARALQLNDAERSLVALAVQARVGSELSAERVEPGAAVETVVASAAEEVVVVSHGRPTMSPPSRASLPGPRSRGATGTAAHCGPGLNRKGASPRGRTA